MKGAHERARRKAAASAVSRAAVKLWNHYQFLA
jgi:hypothetical protein